MQYKRSPRLTQSPCKYDDRGDCNKNVDCNWDWEEKACLQKSPINSIEEGRLTRNRVFNKSAEGLVPLISSFIGNEDTLTSNYPSNPLRVVEILQNEDFSFLDLALFLNKLPNTQGKFNKKVLDILKEFRIRHKSRKSQQALLLALGQSGNYFFISRLVREKEAFLSKLIYGLARGGHLSVLTKVMIDYKILYSVSYLNRALNGAASSGQIDIVKNMLGLGAHSYATSLNLASKDGHLEIVKLMVQYETDPESLGEAFSIASEFGHLHIVQFIYTLGIPEDHLEPAFANAASQGHVNVVNFLIEVGVTNLEQGLNYAAYEGQVQVMERLVQSGDFGTEELNEALVYAADGDEINSVRYLVALGANNIDEALAYAFDNGNVDIMLFLQSLL